MKISIFDLFNIGIGPSSSHTLGPMRAAIRFSETLFEQKHDVSHIVINLYGSLACTGKGHGTDVALMLGLENVDPETLDPDLVPGMIKKIRDNKAVNLLGKKYIYFNESEHLIYNCSEVLDVHTNGMNFTAFDKNNNKLYSENFYSIGGGFIINDKEHENQITEDIKVKYEYNTMNELQQYCRDNNKQIYEIVLENELVKHSKEYIINQIKKIWSTMESAIDRGCKSEGILPGGLKVIRRAPIIKKQLEETKNNNIISQEINYLNLYAMATNEENAAGGRVVTAPTNGASGVIPAIFKYYVEKYQDRTDETLLKFFLTAGAIGTIFKKNASISGAEMGCQGEVGTASSMAAGALTAILGGTSAQIEKAAEIAIEHHLGMTCDPIDGLVQIPCIERNAMGAVKAFNASQIALLDSSKPKITLDNAIITMKQTGQDMLSKYKETSQGGLAAVHVNIPEC